MSGETTFQEEVYSWFGKVADEPINTLELLEAFYQTNAEKPLTEEQSSILRSLIVELYRKAGYTEPQAARVETLKRVALNNRLSTIPNADYRIDETPEKAWVLVRYRWPRE